MKLQSGYVLMWMLLGWQGSAWSAALPGPDVSLGNALARSPDETRGQRIFQQRCQQCHQANATGSVSLKAPALAGQHYEYLVKQVVDFLDQDRVTITMQQDTMHQQLVASGLNNATSIADVVGYVSNLPRNPAPERGPGTLIAQGKKIYDGFCASCHGANAEGNNDWWVPNLRGQHYGYLVAQMRAMARAQRANVSEDLHRMFTTYADEEFQAVADWLTSSGTVH